MKYPNKYDRLVKQWVDLQDKMKTNLKKAQELHEHMERIEKPSVNYMRTELMYLDHDCKNGPDDGCSYCARLYEATEEDIKKEYKKAIQKGHI